MGRRNRRVHQYTLEEKAHALAYMDTTGKPKSQCARDLNVNLNTLLEWDKRRKLILADAEEQGIEVEANRHLKGGLTGSQRGELADAIVRAEEQKLNLAAKVEAVIDRMLEEILDKTEDANLDQTVSAITALLDRLENMTYRPGTEAREGIRAAAESRAPKAVPERTERALVEALRPRGTIPPEAEPDGDRRTEPN
jgi:transposase-like protein